MSSGNYQWYWNAASNPFDKTVHPEWVPYSDGDNKKIEEARIRNETKVELAGHNIHFNEMMQVNKSDFHKQRPVRRTEK